MTAPSHATTPQVLDIPRLMEDIRNGYLAVPRFQRPLVWTDEQRIELFRSVLDGVPIGSILQWRTRIKLATYPNLGPHRLATSREGELIHYLLDGHQRLSTLYGSLVPVPQPPEVNQHSGFAEDVEWRMFYDLKEETFRLGPRGWQPWWLPMDVVLDGRRLRQYQRELERALRITEDPGPVESWIERTDEVALAFSRYEIPVMPFLSDDIDQAIRTFERINSQGTPMSEVHMVAALTWTEGFDFVEQVQSVRAVLAEVGWQDLDEKLVLQTCKAALDMDVTKAPKREKLQAREISPEVIQQAGTNLAMAAIFLKDHCRVHGPAMLPYSLQLVLLADAFRLGGSPLADDTDRLDALRRWFWLTTFTEYFAGMNSARWSRAQAHIRNIVEINAPPMPPEIRDAVVRPLKRFDPRAARSRALAMLLAREDDIEMLAEKGKDAIPKLLSGRDGANNDGVENRIICRPADWRRLRRDLTVQEYGRAPELFDSHHISPEAAAALRAGDVGTFLGFRRATILEIEGSWVTDLDLRYEQADEAPPT